MSFDAQRYVSLVIILVLSWTCLDAQAQQKVVVVPLGETAKSKMVRQTLSIPDAAFTPLRGSYQVTKAFSSSGAYVSGGSGSFVQIVAPFHLPEAASMDSAVVYFRDRSIGEDLTLIISRTKFDGTLESLATATTAGSSDDIRSIELLSEPITIDNTSGGYYIRAIENDWIQEGDDLQIHGVKIEYSYEN